jgi:hypothetical protein
MKIKWVSTDWADWGFVSSCGTYVAVINSRTGRWVVRTLEGERIGAYWNLPESI